MRGDEGVGGGGIGTGEGYRACRGSVDETREGTDARETGAARRLPGKSVFFI